MTRSKLVVELRTALDGSAFVRPREVSHGEERVREHVESLGLFFEVHGALLQAEGIRTLWVDNTIAAAPPPSVDAVVPPWVERVHYDDNAWGSQNKGLGLMAAWRQIDAELAAHEWLIHVEGRSLVDTDTFLRAFLANPRNLFKDPWYNRYAGGGWLQTSMFACATDELRKIAALEFEPLRRTSIERLLYSRFKELEIPYDVIQTLHLRRIDPAQDRVMEL